MPTEDAYSSGHLVLSHFGACRCSNVETGVSWACLVSGLLGFEHPSVLLFLLVSNPIVFRQLNMFHSFNTFKNSIAFVIHFIEERFLLKQPYLTDFIIYILSNFSSLKC